MESAEVPTPYIDIEKYTKEIFFHIKQNNEIYNIKIQKMK